MARLDCDHETIDGVTLVECRLASDARERVTVEPTHDGPIWPSRRQGVPEAGWRDGSWTGVVEPGTTRGLGYATPADVSERPARLAATAPATEETDEPVSARAVIRSLGDPSPARDAVPVGAPSSTSESGAAGTPTTHATGQATARTAEAGLTPTRSAESANERGPGRDSHDGPTDGSSVSEREGRPAATRDGRHSHEVTATASRRGIEDRLRCAERLSTASSVPEAREAVAAAGGMAAVRSLVSQLEADRERLVARRDRAARLAERIEAIEVPVEALARVV